jgi:hypothetical protein
MNNYLFFLAIVISGILISCSKGGPSNEIILEELTNGSFDDGLKFSKNGTFSWEIEDGPKISGKYEIGKLTKWENDAGYTGMRHLSWSITFTDVSGSTYWDEDNSMLLSYDWNHSRAKKKLILKGKSSYYPIECIKVVSGDKLIEKYWNEKNPETIASNKKETKEVLKKITGTQNTRCNPDNYNLINTEILPEFRDPYTINTNKFSNYFGFKEGDKIGMVLIVGPLGSLTTYYNIERNEDYDIKLGHLNFYINDDVPMTYENSEEQSYYSVPGEFVQRRCLVIGKVSSIKLTPAKGPRDLPQFDVKLENHCIEIYEDTDYYKTINSEDLTYYKIQDPDGYSNMRDAPGGSIIRRVLPNEKFKVSGESRKYKVVEFDNGETGYIHNSRVVEYR